MIKSILIDIKSELRKIINGKKIILKYEGKTTVLNTTYGHPLKNFLKSIKLYDRFLPHLVKNTGMGVIDIGSNIGDTMSLIKTFSDVPMICVEPDERFLKLLEKNINCNDFKNVTVYPFAISNTKKVVTIEHNSIASTGNITSAETNAKQIPTKSFSDLVFELDINSSEYQIIKIDTDGFDWDCLQSIAFYFRQNRNHSFMYIFYEHQTYLNNLGFQDPDIIIRENKYIETLTDLNKLGFNHYYLFDNFGTFMFKTTSLSDLKILVEYVRRTMTDNSIPTIYFFDILICKNSYCGLVEKSLQDYKISPLSTK